VIVDARWQRVIVRRDIIVARRLVATTAAAGTFSRIDTAPSAQRVHILNSTGAQRWALHGEVSGEGIFHLARIDVASVADDQMFLRATMKK